MAQAARMRYMDNMNDKEIGSELGVMPQTVRRYFSQDSMERFKRKFSDMEKFRLQRMIEQDLGDAVSTSMQSLAKAKQEAETSNEYRKVAESALKIREKKIDLLQELQVLEKPKERSKVETGADTDELRQELVQGLKGKRKELMEKNE